MKSDFIMKKFLFLLYLSASFLLTSCAVIPKETVTLSKTVGEDLLVLHQSHRAAIEILFNRIENDINTFIDNTYSPYIIHTVLQDELNRYKIGDSTSLYGIIVNAGMNNTKEATDEAVGIMLEFTEAAKNQIESKREELLVPIIKQKNEIMGNIDSSYQNVIYANSTLTAYLESTRRLKESQGNIISGLGLDGLDDSFTEKLLELSDFMDEAIKVGNTIDTKSDEAQQKIDEIIAKIKNITNNITK